MNDSARDRFHKGQRVQYSNTWLRQQRRGPRASQRQMTVVGFGRLPHLVRVLADGAKTPGNYHILFLEPLPDADPGAG
jgi:hypothetical protein